MVALLHSPSDIVLCLSLRAIPLLLPTKSYTYEKCPVPATIDSMTSRKGTVLIVGETKAVDARVHMQSRAGKLEARYDHGRGLPQVRVSSSMISRWRQSFRQHEPGLFADQRDPMR